jgi:hypothetical protein
VYVWVVLTLLFHKVIDLSPEKPNRYNYINGNGLGVDCLNTNLKAKEHRALLFEMSIHRCGFV